MSFREQKELERIQDALEYDEEQGRWKVKYPLLEPPENAAGTFHAAKKCLQSLEKRLHRAGLAQKYEDQINDFISRGVIGKMTPEELKNNDENQYYCVHNFVEKEDSTTPVRIVTNSSFKSPKTQKSMNDILVKGLA